MRMVTSTKRYSEKHLSIGVVVFTLGLAAPMIVVAAQPETNQSTQTDTSPANSQPSASNRTSAYTAGGADVLPTLKVRAAYLTAPSGFVANHTQVGTKTNDDVVDIPASVSVVTHDELVKRNVGDVQSALNYTSSVVTDQYGSDNRFDYMYIRGFEETTLGTYRDGLPARIPGNYTTSRLEPYGLESVEVLKGSTSSLFGLNAPGGLVNAVTKRPASTPLREVYSTMGDGHVETGADVGGPVDKEGKWSYRLTVKRQKADQGYHFTKDDRTYIAPAFTYRPDDNTSLTILTDFNQRKGNGNARGYPQGTRLDRHAFLGEPGYNRFNTRQINFAYLFEHKFDDHWTVRSNARYTNTHLNYADVWGDTLDDDGSTLSRDAFNVQGRSQRIATDNQIEYDNSWGVVDSKTLMGIEFTHDSTREKELYGSASPIDIHHPVYCGKSCISMEPFLNWHVVQNALGAYGQQEFTLDKQWILTLGLRYDHVRTSTTYLDDDTNEVDKEHAYSRRIGLTYKFNPNLSVYANYSQSFQPLVAATANGYTVNGTLKPQRGKQYEVGVKYRPDSIDALFTAAVFDLTQTNVMENVSEVLQRQVGKVGVKGLELEGKFSLTDRMDAVLAYSYWKSKIISDGNEGDVGKRPINVPRQVASAWLDYTQPNAIFNRSLSMGAGIRYVGQEYGDSDNTVSIGGHVVVDAMLGYDFTDNISMQINAVNLFNRIYTASCDGSSCYYGDPREVLATLRYRM